VAAGAVLHQLVNGQHQPLEFFSTKFSSTEQRYSTFDRELLSIVLAVKHFKHFLVAKPFIIRTDHKPLVNMMTMKNPSPRQQRQISYLSEFSFKITYLPGENNEVADFLSRSISVIKFRPIFTTERLLQFKPTLDDLSHFHDTSCVDGIIYDTSLSGTLRPILAKELRKEAFDHIHGLHHPGSSNTYKLLHIRVIWPNMRKDVKLWTSQCIQCQKFKTSRNLKPPLYHFPTTSRFETVHIDLVGPLLVDRSYQYILTMLDRSSRWPEAVPLKHIDAETVSKTFLTTWVCRYGAPKYLISDQGRQFESEIFKALTKRLGTIHVHTSPYHPQSNGALERFHRTFKTSLKILADNNSHWVDVMPHVLLGWRNTPSTSTSATPSQALFGTSTRFMADLTDCNVTPNEQEILSARTHFENLNKDNYCRILNNFQDFIPKTLFDSKFLWLKNPLAHGLQPTYTGPYKIIEIFSHNVRILKNGVEEVVHLNNVKPAFIINDDDTEFECTNKTINNSPDLLLSNRNNKHTTDALQTKEHEITIGHTDARKWKSIKCNNGQNRLVRI